MGFLILLGAIFGVPFISALACYMGARILFPDMGLGVPGYWKFYWAAFFASLIWAAIYGIKELIDGN